MLVFAHCDDETIAVGSRMERFRHALFLHATNSAPKNGEDSRAHGFDCVEAYSKTRREEFLTAMCRAGIEEAQHACLAIADQEASLHLKDLTEQITSYIEKWQPKVLFTHPYEGGHPDHDACSFAVQHAVGLLQGAGFPVPMVIEGAFYHAGKTGMVTGEFLEEFACAHEAECLLTQAERKRKQALLDCFATQQETLRGFSLEYERFRVAPDYDFTQPPHAEPVFYDRQPWGMTSSRFCELACEAADALLASTKDFACH